MNYDSSAELCKAIAKKSGGTVLLAFSAGKDSVSAWVELKKYFHTIIPVYYYLIPGLSFIEQSLLYYEKFFGTRIIRLPNPALIKMLNAGTYQTPDSRKVIESFALPIVKREDLIGYLKEDLNLPDNVYTAVGNRMADSPARRMSIKRFGPVNERTKSFYPTYDFLISDVVNSIREGGVKLPVDYHLFGKSFDGLDYRFIKPIKDHYPEDYKQIKSFFPFIDLEFIRYEQL